MNAGMLLGAIGVGAGLMYVLDPERGGRRRGLFRDKAVSAINKTGDALGTTSRDIANRAAGLWAETSSLAAGDDAQGSSSARGASGT
jgi:hypothetical protein